jgi:mannose-1-phosphate guanylyltransferase/phosphomannomutase
MMALAEEEKGKLAYGSGFKQEPIFPEFQPAFDALYAIVKIMEMLATEGVKLHQLNDLVPHWFFRHRAIACPWERKGEVMRTIADQYAPYVTEMIDGVRVASNGDWFLVLPDASHPSVNVYVEGHDNDSADHLVGEVSQRIAGLVGA